MEPYCLRFETGARVLKEIHSPNLQIILDPVNLLSVENCGDYESVFAQAIQDLGEYTAVLHMKDFVVKDHTIVSGRLVRNHEIR